MAADRDASHIAFAISMVHVKMYLPVASRRSSGAAFFVFLLRQISELLASRHSALSCQPPILPANL